MQRVILGCVSFRTALPEAPFGFRAEIAHRISAALEVWALNILAGLAKRLLLTLGFNRLTFLCK